jgi:hypothetical protein
MKTLFLNHSFFEIVGDVDLKNKNNSKKEKKRKG